MTMPPFPDLGADDAPAAFTEVLLPSLMDALLETRELDAFLARVPAAMEQAGLSHLQPTGTWLARDLWSTTPLPWEGFRTRPLPKPERNDPCPCGSSRKFKRCCREGLPSLEILGAELLEPLLVERLGRADRARARKEAPASLRVEIALHDLQTDHPGRAKKLLLEVLAKPRTDEFLEARALALLGDAYRALGQLRAGIDRLAELTPQRKGAPASAGCETMAMLELLDEDPVSALLLLDRALKHDDRNFMAGLCRAETLGFIGRSVLAREELERWRPMVEEEGAPELLELLAKLEDRLDTLEAEDEIQEALEAGADDPDDPDDNDSFLGNLLADSLPTPESNAAWSESLEPALGEPLAPLRFEPGPPGEEGEPSAILIFAPDVEAARQAKFELEEASEPYALEDADLQDWLRRHPAGLQCPDALRQIMDRLRMSALWQSLNEYRDRLLEHCLAPVPEGTTLPWGWLENRPLLRLLLDAALDAEPDEEPEYARRRFEQLLALGPDDPQGALPLLVNLLLREGHNEEALAWIEQDRAGVHPEPAFGAVLALARLGRVRDAEAAFREAHRKLPKVLAHLRQERKPPRDLQPGVVRLGGDDQAWYYGNDMRDAFQNEPGLVAFMTDLAKRMERGL